MLTTILFSFAFLLHRESFFTQLNWSFEKKSQQIFLFPNRIKTGSGNLKCVPLSQKSYYETKVSSSLRRPQSPQGQKDVPGLPDEIPLKLTSRGSFWRLFHSPTVLGFWMPNKAPVDSRSDGGKTGAAENQAGGQLQLRKHKSVSFIQGKKNLLWRKSCPPQKQVLTSLKQLSLALPASSRKRE